jgi:hypothetical protein
MENKDILIIAQVVAKLFVDTEHRLPENEEDTIRLTTAILKVYKAAQLAQAKINSIKK